jgi:hypothetical protein
MLAKNVLAKNVLATPMCYAINGAQGWLCEFWQYKNTRHLSRCVFLRSRTIPDTEFLLTYQHLSSFTQEHGDLGQYMASTQPQILIFTPPSMPYKVAVPVWPVPPLRQEAQQLTISFGSMSRADNFQMQQTKQVEKI